MKKTYITPSVEVFNVNTVRMLAASSPFPGGIGDGELTPGKDEDLGRDDNNPGGNLWDQVW